MYVIDIDKVYYMCRESKYLVVSTKDVRESDGIYAGHGIKIGEAYKNSKITDFNDVKMRDEDEDIEYFRQLSGIPKKDRRVFM